METDRAWIELDLDNLKHNVKELNSAMPAGCRMMAVVKAEAYGHGALQITDCLQRLGVDAFAVATIDEGIALRQSGIDGEILILGYTCPARAAELERYCLMPTLISYEHALALEEQGCKVKAHMKIDTGMHRLGYDAADLQYICSSFQLRHIQIAGIFTHLCVSDSLEKADAEFTERQIECFYKLIDTLRAMGLQPGKLHIQSSYGLLNYPQLQCDYARVGIALYGVFSSANDVTKQCLDLRPVLSIRSRIVLVRTVQAGETVGYGRDFTARRDSRIAILPIGYADGIPRCLSSGKGTVLVNGQKAPIIGRICMDQCTIDVTDIPDAKPGTLVTLVGKDGECEITVSQVADSAGTISNELLSRLGRRLPAVVRQASYLL